MRCIRDLKFFLAAGIFVMSGIAISADAVEKKASPSVKISFPYIRQSGIASNQFAVWVENANRQFIKTLYVTSYTGKGGYAVRKDCVPTWVRRSGAANTPKTELDAVSGATPVSGTLTYTWDCKGKDGKIIAPGKYKIFVEGTLRWKSRVLYTANITVGKNADTARAQPQYSVKSDNHGNMIGTVTATYTPSVENHGRPAFIHDKCLKTRQRA